MRSAKRSRHKIRRRRVSKAKAPSESARHWAVRRLTQVADQFPSVDPPDTDTSGLSPADAALALAIYRTTVQRWLTLQPIVETYLSKQARRLEPAMQAVLMSGAAQLVFFDRLPGYAVVDESVELARKLVRANASGMANAVLRQIDRLTTHAKRVDGWSADASMIPLAGGKALQFSRPVMPPVAPLDKHLAAATSMPLRLAREWIQRWGEADATRLCLQAIEHPPTTVALEHGFDAAAHRRVCKPHQHGGFAVWDGSIEQLTPFLDQHPERRVQDVASSLAVASTAGHSPASVLDYCAGVGTKTRQLALLHPSATVTATDVHPGRRDTLRQATAGLSNVRVVEPEQVGAAKYDLVLLDVPCSNTGVLARRPEARYRFSQQSLGELVKLQREILETACRWVKPGGLLLYSTCSIEPPENRKQIDKRLRQGGERLQEHQQLPSGTGDSYTDGSYHALVRL